MLKHLKLDNFLSETLLSKMLNAIRDVNLTDGKLTASGSAKKKKYNLQASLSAAGHHQLQSKLQSYILKHPVFTNMLFAKKISTPIFSKYEVGMKYEWHLDDAFMAGGIRSDFSFTLFLSDPQSYDGGQLIVERDIKGQSIEVKPAKNTMFVYNTENYHQVTEVTRGERIALVGWVESFVQSEEKRVLLRDFLSLKQQIKNLKNIKSTDLKVTEDLIKQLEFNLQKLKKIFSS